MKNQVNLKNLTKNEYAGALIYSAALSTLKGLTYSLALSLAVFYLFKSSIPFYFLFLTVWLVPSLISNWNYDMLLLKLQKFYGLSDKTLAEKQAEFLSSDDNEEK